MRFGLPCLRRDEAAADGEGGGGGAGSQPDVAALNARIKELETASAEKDNAAQYWHGKYKEVESKKPTPAAAAATETAVEDDTDPIEQLSRKGVKGFKELGAKSGFVSEADLDAALAKRGFVRADDVDARINTRAGQIAAENELVGKYPELKDTKSEFFKDTARRMAELQKDGVPATKSMVLAAKEVHLEWLESGKKISKPEAEEREARGRAASGDSGKGGKKAADADEGDDELTPFMKQLCIDMEITEDQYRARAKKGVNMQSGTQLGGKR